MFGIGLVEIFVVLVIALLVIGPKDLPDAARKLARLVKQGKRMITDLKNSIDIDDDDRK